MQDSKKNRIWSEATYSERAVPIIINIKKVIPGITINIINNKQISDEKNKIQIDAIEAIKTTFKTQGKIEVYLLDDKEHTYFDNQFTNSISSISVTLTYADLFQDLIDRVAALEKDHVDLKKDHVDLKKDIVDLKKNRYKIELRAMIELGRQHYWNIYYDSYKIKYGSNLINTREEYDEESNIFVLIDSPKFWTHFMIFVKDTLPDTNQGLINLLKGGKGSEYNNLLSNDIHHTDEEDFLKIVQYYNNDSITKLFELLFNKTIDEYY